MMGNNGRSFWLLAYAVVSHLALGHDCELNVTDRGCGKRARPLDGSVASALAACTTVPYSSIQFRAVPLERPGRVFLYPVFIRGTDDGADAQVCMYVR
jgi:hypothetical protein